METKIIEAAHGPDGGNWGKFLLGRPDTEWSRLSEVDTASRRPLLAQRGWSPGHLWACDLETGEGVYVHPGGSARADLGRHQVWVCPLFEPFLEWLYRQDLADLQALPDVVYLPGAPFAQYGYRRGGPAAGLRGQARALPGRHGTTRIVRPAPPGARRLTAARALAAGRRKPA